MPDWAVEVLFVWPGYFEALNLGWGCQSVQGRDNRLALQGWEIWGLKLGVGKKRCASSERALFPELRVVTSVTIPTPIQDTSSSFFCHDPNALGG